MRFKAKQDAIIRELPEVTIILCGSKVYVYPRGQRTGSVFYRAWGEYGWTKRGEYKQWQLFYQKMLRNQHLNLAKCYELALKYGAMGTHNGRPLNLEGKKVVKRH